MQKYIIAITVVISFFLAGVGSLPVMAADQGAKDAVGKQETGISSYSDRELQLAFENCQLRIQAAQQQIIDARNLMQQIQSEAKKRQEKAKQGAAGKPEKEVKKTDKPAQ